MYGDTNSVKDNAWQVRPSSWILHDMARNDADYRCAINTVVKSNTCREKIHSEKLHAVFLGRGVNLYVNEIRSYV